ncbi:hypothetical protein TELCIR_07419 [Teladorsagia circumcincta]|uniref:Uncharacterized protein n=1 Tax=Teladorsagia circumcincta TaxID=45464 RepID=A0A2G9UKD1_TELCI|nr:hypothetical protein TELCIR_07419 [Teladorsagia circumcincta]
MCFVFIDLTNLSVRFVILGPSKIQQQDVQHFWTGSIGQLLSSSEVCDRFHQSSIQPHGLSSCWTVLSIGFAW